MTTKEITALFKKYEVEVDYFRKSGIPVAVNAIKFCEKNNIKLDKPLFSRAPVSGNAIIHYFCDCGEKANSGVSGFLKKTVFACKKCNAGKINKIFKPLKSEDVTKTIEDNGFKVVETDHDGVLATSKWTLRCSFEHDFVVSGSHVQGIKNCPHCYKSSLEEEWTRSLVEHHFGKSFPNVRPDWLINPETDKNLELDIYNEEMALAIEYHGPQHYEPIFGEERLLKSLRNDGARRIECKKNAVRLIEIKHPEKKLNKEGFLKYIVMELRKHKISIKNKSVAYALALEIDCNKTGKILDGIKSRLTESGKTFVSCQYENAYSPVYYQCDDCKAEHYTTGSKVGDLKAGCPTCRKAERKNIVVLRHEKLARTACKKMKASFKELTRNHRGNVTGFICIRDSEIVPVGNKRYRQLLTGKNIVF